MSRWHPMLVTLVLVPACAPDAVLVSSGGGGDTGGSGGALPACELAYTNVPQGECDMHLQNCAAPDACTVVLDGADRTTTCTPTWGGKGPGEKCQLTSECETSLACLLERCSPACCSSTNNNCGPGGYCLVRQYFGPQFLQRCGYWDSCELFVADSCAQSDPPGICHVLPDYGVAACVPPSVNGVRPEGEICFADDECGPAQLCFPRKTTTARCRFNCYMDASGSGLPGEGGCPAGQACQQFDTGIDNLGVCMPL